VVSLFAAHVDNEMYLSRSLERLGGNAFSKDQEPDIEAAFLKFAVVTKELSALMKTLVSTSLLLSQIGKKNSVALVRERTIPTERPPPVGEVSANFGG